jgi:hypothetical protein
MKSDVELLRGPQRSSIAAQAMHELKATLGIDMQHQL